MVSGGGGGGESGRLQGGVARLGWGEGGARQSGRDNKKQRCWLAMMSGSHQSQESPHASPHAQA